MKLSTTLLTAAAFVMPYASAKTTTTTTTRNLRGKVVHTRTVYIDNDKHLQHDQPSTLRHFDHESHLNVRKENHKIHHGESNPLHPLDHESNLNIHNGKNIRHGDSSNLHHFDHESHLNIHHGSGKIIHHGDSNTLSHFDHESHLNIHNTKHIRRYDPRTRQHIDHQSHLKIHNDKHIRQYDPKTHHHFDHEAHLNPHNTKHVRHGEPDTLRHFDHDSHLNLRQTEQAIVNQRKSDSHINHREPETMVDPHSMRDEHHHYVRIPGRTSGGDTRWTVLDLDQLEDKLPHDFAIFTKNNHVFQDEKKNESRKKEGAPRQQHSDHVHYHRAEHLRSDRESHDESSGVHFDRHDEVEKNHQLRHHTYHKPKNQTQSRTKKETNDDFEWKRDRSMYTLPTGLASHYNETLFDELHNAPFRVYAEALGHELDENESFPVFALPQWINTTGVFTGFSKQATPLIFENVQFLLHWDEIVATATSPISSDLAAHIADNNFHASLIVGKSIGNGANVPFIGMIICYYQFGSSKSVLVPFSKLEDFFDNTSEKHLLDPKTKSMEMAALHDMLEERRTNSSTFYHPALAHSEERKAQLEDLEITHFQKLFQLLIRRSFLFSFGFADCLVNEPHNLRACLDDTFYHIIDMETTTRGALDDEVIDKLAEINETFHSKVSEACVSVQGSGNGMMYGSGSCYNTNDLGAFFGNFATF